MTQDEIIRMAREAGFPSLTDYGNQCLERFAALVAEATKAQPQGEQVAWGVFEGNLHDMFFGEEEAVQMAGYKSTHAEVKPLYTTPPSVEASKNQPSAEQIAYWYSEFEKHNTTSEELAQPQGEPDWYLITQRYTTQYEQAIAAAIEATKEKAAKVCEEEMIGFASDDEQLIRIAAAIRSMK